MLGIRRIASVLVLGGSIAVGCSSATSGSKPGGGAGGVGGTGASGGAGGGAGASASGGTGGFDTDSSTGGSAGGCPQCSADLKNVVDCNGDVVQACPGNQACSGGQCVDDACGAAKAAKSTYGCEYWALNTDNILRGACFAAFVANTWTTNVKISVEYNGQTLPVGSFAKLPVGQGPTLKYSAYDANTGLAPGEVAILFLAQTPQFAPPLGEACPAGITPAITTDPAVKGTGLGKAFHITTDEPVVAYQIFPYGGGNAAITSATLLLPTSAWDNNYVAVNAYAETQIANNPGLPSLDILAGEDGTEVTISPVADIQPGKLVQGTPAGQPLTYQLARGQFVQFSQIAELTGSAILANKPVAVFGGSSCMNVRVGEDACDTGMQQIPPVRALGSEYAAVRYRGRGGQEEVVPWRVVGAVDGTTLDWSPAAPGGAPTTLNKGQVIEFESPGPFLVKSQDANHPFYMAAYMTGGSNFNGEGDPEFVNVIPTGQYLSSYVFFTDPTYPETNLVIVRKAGKNGFADVQMDCGPPIGGWQNLGPYQWTRVDLVTGAFKSVNGCANGRHMIKSDAPFGVTVWGWGSLKSAPYMSQYVSYAYPAGAGVAPLSDTVVQPIPK